MNTLKTLLAILIITTMTTEISYALRNESSFTGNRDTTLSRKQADAWYKKKEWLGGLNATPHASVDKIEFSKQYHAHKDWWDKGFAYLKNTDFSNIKPGKYPLDGDNVYVTVSEGPAKAFEQSKFESHKDYSDIHYVLTGKEKIGVAEVSKGKIIQPYDDDKDIQFLTADGKYYEAVPGTFFIFFPHQAHRPGIKTEGADTVKKVVVKIKTPAL